MHALVVGGGSGLGLEIAKLLKEQGADVTITGRDYRSGPWGMDYKKFILTQDTERLVSSINTLALDPTRFVDLLVWAPGFWEDGNIDGLSDEHILAMVNVGLLGPALMLNRLLDAQDGLEGFIAITSTSQWKPREREPLYCATKAGLAQLARCVSLDSRVDKVLVAGPAGMATGFWSASGRDLAGLLDPKQVAEQILRLWEGEYRFKLARILRDPMRVQVLDPDNIGVVEEWEAS